MFPTRGFPFIITLICLFPSTVAVQDVLSSGCDIINAADRCSQQPAANCSNKDLDGVPQDLPTDIVCLWLSGNHISKLEASSFQRFSHLKELDISYNLISIISNDTFSTLSKLSKLNLSSNQQLEPDDDTSVESSAFEGLSNLELLTFYNLSISSKRYNGHVFTNMKNLRELHIDGMPEGQVFPREFANLYHLEKLYIYGKFNRIANGTFTNLSNTNVSLLDIKSKLLYDIEPLGFQPLKNLKDLSLSHNSNLGFQNLSNGCWYGLQFTTIENLYLEEVYSNFLEHGSASVINSDFFQYLNMTRIKTLILDNNKLVYIEPKIHSSLKYLEHLSFDYNQIQNKIDIALDIALLMNLKYWSFSYQQKVPLDTTEYTKTGKYGMKHAYGEGADTGINQVYKSKPTVTSQPYIFYVPVSLEVLLLDSFLTNIVNFLDKHRIIGGFNLKHFNFSGNYVKRLIGPVFWCGKDPTDFEFYIENNGIEYINPNGFQHCKDRNIRITKISLFNNYLGPQIEKTDNWPILHKVTDLRELNFGRNYIKSIPFQALCIESLESLDLSLNLLRQINFDISCLKNLTHLYLTSNLLSAIDHQARDSLDHLANKKPLQIFLEGNPLICSCDTLDFLQWLLVTEVQVVNYLNYTCIFDNKEITLEKLYDRHFKKFQNECQSKTYIIASVTGAVFIVLVVALSVCFFRFRHDVRYLCALFVHKRKKYQEVADVDNHYEFDAFVAHHEDDKEWVMNELVEKLECAPDCGSEKISFCLHQREFEPGTSIVDNIIEHVKISRKTIIILTNSFVTSSWCDFELNMAQMKCFEEGRDLIVIIMLEQVDPKLMSKTLKALVRRITYIKWPDNPNDLPKFWDAIKKSLRIPEAAPLMCECGKYVSRHSAPTDV